MYGKKVNGGKIEVQNQHEEVVIMTQDIADLYSDYLLSSFGQTTATGLSKLMNDSISHDQVTRMLSGKKQTSKEWWLFVKSYVRQIQ